MHHLKLISIAFAMVFCIASAFAQKRYPTISYLKIQVDSMGNMKQNPYVLDLKKNDKRLFVIGTQHTRDTASPIFTAIEQAFIAVKPQIVVNEGGNLTKTYTTRNAAIENNGELGLEKYLADKAGIKTINGDMPDKLEFEALCRKYSKGEIVVYFASERFVFPYVFGEFKGDLKQLYSTEFIKGYLLKEGIILSPKEQTFEYYKRAYKKYFHKDFSIHNISQRDFIPFGTGSHFNAVARASKETRDQYLLNKLSQLLKPYSRILLVFGGWHILATEPALKRIVALQ